MKKTPEEQIDRLARFIMENIEGEPSRNEGAVDTAIRLLDDRPTSECPSCGARMMDAAKHKQWHDWLERQLATASVGFPTGLMR